MLLPNEKVCALCHCEKEDTYHLFFNCQVSKSMESNELLYWFQVSAYDASWKFFIGCSSFFKRYSNRRIIDNIWLAVVWGFGNRETTLFLIMSSVTPITVFGLEMVDYRRYSAFQRYLFRFVYTFFTLSIYVIIVGEDFRLIPLSCKGLEHP